MFGDQGLSVGEFCSQRAQATVVHECGIPQLFIAGDLLSGSGESPGLFPAQLFYGCLLCLTDFACFFDRKMFSSASWATSDACGRMAEKYFNRAWLGTVHQAEQGQVLQKSRGCVKRN